MPTALRDRLSAELERVQTQARALAEKDSRDESTEANLKELLDEGRKLQARADELVAIDGLTAPRAALDQAAAANQPRPDSPGTLGEWFVRSEAFQSYPAHGTSGKVAVPFELLTRAPLTTVSGSGTPWQTKDRIAIAAPSLQTPLLDVVGRVRVASNAVEWVTYPAAAPLAAVVPEGSPKPEATITASVSTITLDTLAHWAQATRQLLEDSSAARDFINAELSRGVTDKIEAEIAGALAAATLPAVTGDDLMSGIRHAVGAVQSAGFRPNTVVLNPTDYADLDIAVFGSTLLGPAVSGSFWGLRPVAAAAVPAGSPIVGDFSAGVNYLERTSVSVYVTDSHANTFISNVFTFLAEARGKAVVTRPEALAEVSVTSP